MLHVACLCPAVPGHLNPTIAIGKELAARGHRITVISLLDAKPAVTAANLAFQPLGEAEFPIGSIPEFSVILGTLRGREALRFTLDYLAKSAQVTLRDLPGVLDRAGVDGMIIDQLHAGGSTVADYLNLPFVTLCNALMTNREAAVPPVPASWSYRDSWWAKVRNEAGWALLDRLMRPVATVCREQRRQWGLPPWATIDDSYSSLAQISQQPRGFDFPRKRLPQHFHYVGPLTNEAARTPVDFPFERLNDKPLVYASLGTLQNQLRDIFRVIIDACEPLPVQLVLSLGSAGSNVRQSLPDWPLIVDYAPQLQLLERASLTITHAGLNTTLESLRSGVPMVAIPITNDQPGVAARIAHTGVGEMVPLHRLQAGRLRRTVQRVLEIGSYRDAARRYQQQIAESPGPPHAADIVERAITTKEPVRSSNGTTAPAEPPQRSSA